MQTITKLHPIFKSIFKTYAPALYEQICTNCGEEITAKCNAGDCEFKYEEAKK